MGSKRDLKFDTTSKYSIQSGANSIRQGGAPPPEEDNEQAGTENNIFTNLNTIIIDEINSGVYETEELERLIRMEDPLAYMAYSEHINECPGEFNRYIFENKLGQETAIDGLTGIFIREVNELWKFMHFLFSCVANYEMENNTEEFSFSMLIEFIKMYCAKLKERDLAKFNNFFTSMFINEYVKIYKNCKLFEKKVHVADMLYFFYEDKPEQRYEA